MFYYGLQRNIEPDISIVYPRPPCPNIISVPLTAILELLRIKLPTWIVLFVSSDCSDMGFLTLQFQSSYHT